MQRILGYNPPIDSSLLYFCNFVNDTIQWKDKYLAEIFNSGWKKAHRNGVKLTPPPTQDQSIQIVQIVLQSTEEIYLMEKLTHIVRLQEKIIINIFKDRLIL